MAIRQLARCLVVVAVVASVLGTATPQAGAGLDPSGELDTAFDTDGFTTTNFAQVNSFAEARGIGFQTQGPNAGRIILAGGYQEGFNDHLALLRLNPDGTQDTSFGGAGEVKTVIGTTDIAEDVAIQPDDKIIVAGWSDSDFLVVRYLADGGLDTGFGGGDGFVLAGNVANQFDRGQTVTLQSDGKILVGGYSYVSPSGERDMSIMRFSSAGVLDTTFGGGDGIATINIGALTERARGLAVQPDGKIVVAGQTLNGTGTTCNGVASPDHNSAVARLLADGSLDTSFSGDGIMWANLATTNCPSDGFRAVALQSDGKVVAAGFANTTQDSSTNAKSNISVARFNPDGSFDTTFDSDGRTWTAIASTATFQSDLAEDVAILPSGNIVAGAYSTGNDGNQNFAAVRYTPAGALDSTFDGDGKAVIDFGGNDALDAMALDGTGRPILAGYSYPAGSSLDPRIAAARLTTGGVLDTTFNGTGSFFKPLQGGSVDTGYGLAVQRQGANANKVVVVASTDNDPSYDVGLVRYTTTGALDTSFDGDGKAYGDDAARQDTGRAVTVDAADKILVAGDSYSNDPPPRATLMRFNANGGLDSSFSGDGVATTAVGSNANTWHAVAVQPDGKIVVGGTTSDGASDWDFLVGRFNADGTPDTAFDGDGVRRLSLGTSYDEVRALAIQPDGRILAGGFSFVSSAASHFALVRFHADGSLDNTFDGDGKVITTNGGGDFPRNEIRAVVVLPDGRIVVGGKGNDGGNNTNNVMRLARYQANGALDTSFDGDGRVTTNLASDRFDELSGLALQHDEKLVAFGHSQQLFVTNDDFVLARYNWDDGSLDTTFGPANAGYNITALTPGADRAAGGAVLPGGAAVAGGTAGGSDVGAARYRGDPAPILPAAPDLAAASDFGISSTDNITRDNTPTLTGGSCNTGETTVLKVGGSPTSPLSRQLCRTGTWAMTPTAALADGVHSFSAFSRNGFGDTGDTTALSVTIDTVANPPTLTAPGAGATITIPPSPVINGTVAETIAGATVTISEGGTTVCTATADAGGNWSCASGLGPGAHTITATQTDVAGNTSAASAGLSFTLKAPTETALATSVDPSVYGQPVTFTATVTAPIGTPGGTVDFVVDGGSPVSVALSSGVAAVTLPPPAPLAVGTHTVTASYGGATGYHPSSKALDPSQTVNRADTTLSLTTSKTPSAYGEDVTFTATMSANAPGAGTPTGTVEFALPGQAPATVALAGGVATLTTAALHPGTRTVTAAYSGDASFKPSNGSLDQVVAPGASTTQVTSSVNPSVFGQGVTFTATVAAVAPAPGTPTGSVDFVVDGGTPVTVVLAAGQAVLSTATLTAGAHTVDATYGGDADFGGSTASLGGGQTVNQGATTTGLVSSANPSTFQQSVTFTVTVAPVAPATETPDGTVNVTIDGGTPVALTLAGGTATLARADLAVGNHTVEASYPGNANYTGSTAPLAGGQTVDRAATITELVSSANPTTFQQPVTFTVTLAPVAPATETPDGTVNVTIDGGAPRALTLAGGTATLSLADLAVGDHTVTADYAGNGNFTPSTGPLAGGQTVAKAATTTALGSAPNPSTFGQTVTFTVTVAPVAPATKTPEGTVNLTVDGGAPQALTLSGGQATLDLSDLSGGDHSVTAAYAGNGDFAASSATLSGGQHVDVATATLSVTSEPNPSKAGDTVTFTAVIATRVAAASGSEPPPPTGSVSFVIDGGAPVTVPVENGRAVYQTSSLPAGDHTVAVSYSGDQNYAGTDAAVTGRQIVETPAPADPGASGAGTGGGTGTGAGTGSSTGTGTGPDTGTGSGTGTGAGTGTGTGTGVGAGTGTAVGAVDGSAGLPRTGSEPGFLLRPALALIGAGAFLPTVGAWAVRARRRAAEV